MGTSVVQAPSQTKASHKTRLLRALSSRVPITSKDGDCTASLDNLFQSYLTVLMEELFLVSSLNLSCLCLCLVLYIISLCTTEESGWLFCLNNYL